MTGVADMNVKIGADISDVLSKVDAAKAKLNQLTESNQELKNRVKELNAALSANQKELNAADKSLQKLIADGNGASTAAKNLRAQIAGISTSTTELTADLASTRKELVNNTAQLKVQTVAVRQAENAHSGFAAGATKVYSGLRKLAYIIPGLGIAGLVSLISGPLIDAFQDWYESVNKLNDAQQLLKDNVKNTSDINKAAGESIAKETASLTTLYAIATDVTRSMYARVAATKELQKEFPDYFKNITQENILNGNAKAAYDALTDSLIANALAKAQLDRITDIGVKKSDIKSQVDDLIAERDRQLKAIKTTKIANPLSTLDNSAFAGVTVSPEQQKNEINNYFNQQLKPLQSKINSFDNQIKKIREKLNPAALLSGEGGSSKADTASGVLAVFDAQIKVLEDYKNNIATTAEQIASVNAQIKKLQEERAKYDPKISKEKTVKDVETIADVLKKLAIQIDFLNQKELLLKTDQTQAKIKAIESTIDTLMQKFKLLADNPVIVKLQAQAADLELKDLFKKDTAARKNIKVDVPVEFVPEPTRNYQAFDSESYVLRQKLKSLGVTKTKIGVPIDTANIQELRTTLTETQKRLESIANLTTDTLSPAFDALFTGILTGSQNAFHSFGEALQQAITQLGVALLKAAAFAAIISLIDPSKGGFSKVFSSLTGFSKGGEVKGFSTGGPVWGAGSATSDSIPARLSKGEYVIKAAKVQEFGLDFFNKINFGSANIKDILRDKFGMMKFATGGFVSPNAVNFTRPITVPNISIGGGQHLEITGDFQLRNDRLVAAVRRGTAQISRNS